MVDKWIQNAAYLSGGTPHISIHLMTVGKLSNGASRLSWYEKRLRDLVQISGKLNFEVVSNCGGQITDKVKEQLQTLIDQFDFPICCSLVDGIVPGRIQTLAKARGPLSFFWDDDCIFLGGVYETFQFLLEKLLYSDFGAVGIRSVDLEYKHFKPRPGLKPCLAYPELRRMKDEEVIDYVGEVIPAGIHGMAFLTYTKLLHEVGGFTPFLRNQGEWGAIFTEIWRQKGIPCVYDLNHKFRILHDHAPSSPTRNMDGRFTESCIYMAYYVVRYAPILPNEPLYKIGRERYLRNVAATYGVKDLKWIDSFWERFLDFSPNFESAKEEEIRVNLLDKTIPQNFQEEIIVAVKYIQENFNLISSKPSNNLLYPTIKPFGEFEDMDVVYEIMEKANQRIAPFKEKVF